MATVQYDFSNLEGKYPLYTGDGTFGDGEDAFLFMDDKGRTSATVGAWYSFDISNGVHFRFGLNNRVVGSALVEFLEGEGRGLLQRVLDGHTLHHNGRNLIGRLTDDAEEARQAFKSLVKTLLHR